MSTRLWFRIHSFTGIITGLLLFLICWSGTFAVISNEIDWLIMPNVHVADEGEKIRWGDITEEIWETYPEATIKTIAAPLYPGFPVVVRIAFSGNTNTHVFVNPYNAQIMSATSGFTVQRFFRDFHRRLFFPGHWGHYIVCAFSLTLLLSLIAALSFYKRWWKRFFTLRLKPGHALWSDLHKLVGLWSIWFIFLMVVTGTWYLFEEARGHMGDGISVYAGYSDAALRTIPEPAVNSASARLTVNDLIDSVEMQRPDIDIRDLVFRSYNGEENAILYVAGQSGDLLVRDRANHVQLDTRTGAVLYNQHTSDLPLYWRWSDTADPLHFGNFAGLVSKLIWFVFGLLLSGLILTGTWLHARRLARESGTRVTRSSWPGTLAATLTSILVMALSVPFGIQEAATSYGPVLEGIKRFPVLAPGVQAVILAWIVMTLAIIAAWTLLLLKPNVLSRLARR